MTLAPTPSRKPPAVAIRSVDAEKASILATEMGLSRILSCLLVGRGFDTVEKAEAFLMGGYEELSDPESLEGIAQAADIVTEGVREGVGIVVHGDYDADGVSGAVLVAAFLREVGARAELYIPHRVDEGYGLSAEGVRWAHGQDLRILVSVDCGSSSPVEIALARELGMKVVITDHHMVREVPETDAFVNPRAPGSSGELAYISGAGVAFKLIQAVSQRLGRGEPRAYLDLAAIGTVGDVVPLVGENRIIVREGLEVMQSLARPGLTALLEVCGIVPAGAAFCETTVTARHLAFDLAPRINACGRLEHAAQAAELLLEQDPERARDLAREIDALNQQRREVEASIRREAEKRVLAGPPAEERVVIVEGSRGWHPGVVGITASRLVERFGLPALVVSIGEDGEAKGSARAPSHVDLYACFADCSDLFSRYGGHARAAGFTLKEPIGEDDGLLAALAARMREAVPRHSREPEAPHQVDLEVSPDELEIDLLDDLEQLAPFGQGNPVPTFLARGVRLGDPQRVKDVHLRFRVNREGGNLRCIAFGKGELADVLRADEGYDVVFELEDDTYRGERRLGAKAREILQGGVPLEGRRPDDEPRIPLDVPPPERRALVLDPGPAQAGLALPDGAGAPLVVGPWTATVMDARSCQNRGRYLADLVRTGSRVRVFTRRGLERFVQAVVAGGRDLAVPANLDVVAWSLSGADGSDLDAFDEIVAFTPPPSLELLRPLLGTSRRVHLLFGEDEMREEETVMRGFYLTRDRVVSVYQALKGGPCPFGQQEVATVVSRLARDGIIPDTVKICVRVLREMGVARPVGDGTRFEWTGQQGSLDDSETFRLYAGLQASFEAVGAAFAPGALEARLPSVEPPS